MPIFAAGNPFQHTWDNWQIDLYFTSIHLDHFPVCKQLGITKGTVTLMAAAIILCTMGIIAGNGAKRAQAEDRSTRGLAQLFEVLAEFVRNELMKPAMPHHYKQPWFVATFCSFFFFILTCNLLGLLPQPFGYSATGAWWVTAALAFGGTFLLMIFSGVREHGPIGFVAHMAPPSPWWVRWPLLLPIECFGLVVKAVALTLRLAANMTAGHIILAVLMSFLTASLSVVVASLVWPAAAFGVFAITVFEIAIAFIQAYIFTALSCVFVGQMVSHEH
jgi:F-type H+-transporting ATPase subunit a